MKCKECVYCDIKSSKLDEDLSLWQERVNKAHKEYSSLKDFEEFSKYC